MIEGAPTPLDNTTSDAEISWLVGRDAVGFLRARATQLTTPNGRIVPLEGRRDVREPKHPELWPESVSEIPKFLTSPRLWHLLMQEFPDKRTSELKKLAVSLGFLSSPEEANTLWKRHQKKWKDEPRVSVKGKGSAAAYTFSTEPLTSDEPPLIRWLIGKTDRFPLPIDQKDIIAAIETVLESVVGLRNADGWGKALVRLTRCVALVHLLPAQSLDTMVIQRAGSATLKAERNKSREEAFLTICRLGIESAAYPPRLWDPRFAIEALLQRERVPLGSQHVAEVGEGWTAVDWQQFDSPERLPLRALPPLIAIAQRRNQLHVRDVLLERLGAGLPQELLWAALRDLQEVESNGEDLLSPLRKAAEVNRDSRLPTRVLSLLLNEAQEKREMDLRDVLQEASSALDDERSKLRAALAETQERERQAEDRTREAERESLDAEKKVREMARRLQQASLTGEQNALAEALRMSTSSVEALLDAHETDPARLKPLAQRMEAELLMRNVKAKVQRGERVPFSFEYFEWDGSGEPPSEGIVALRPYVLSTPTGDVVIQKGRMKKL